MLKKYVLVLTPLLSKIKNWRLPKTIFWSSKLVPPHSQIRGEIVTNLVKIGNKTKFLSVQLGKTLALTIVRIYALQLNLCLKV